MLEAKFKESDIEATEKEADLNEQDTSDFSLGTEETASFEQPLNSIPCWQQCGISESAKCYSIYIDNCWAGAMILPLLGQAINTEYIVITTWWKLQAQHGVSKRIDIALSVVLRL